jgi:hypothetical protein
MFLLNSRNHFVIAPCTRTYTDTSTGTLYPEVTGLNRRIPLRRLILYTLGYLPRDTSAGSGYGYSLSNKFLFHGLLASAEYSIRSTILHFTLLLIMTILHRPIRISTNDSLCQSSQKCQKFDLCYHI